ncbi:MAG: hypothetical protein HN712_29630 [Gemmatimonadetes bacterium]|jgi:hypothetical protein|nr:hypothetical protein [Gemmatimonadota bacterium]MBT6148210.1 hypothetical protein [Gemmatimonadota bacterium]MBT7864506.1 hypothetical protein [Gemmatimonadota bacterium]
MLPSVDFCGLSICRLIVGANPFGGFSHQSKSRDAEMVAFHTKEQIFETWARAEASGINTIITNNETPRVTQSVSQYISGGGALQWIAQVNNNAEPDMQTAASKAVEMGCKALYFHGARIDQLYLDKDPETLRGWVEHARAAGTIVGVAAHAPEVHLWVDSLDLVDFHAVPFFNCGSLHDGRGHKFQLKDVGPATQCIRQIQKPVIAYKIMGAGRIDARMAFEYAFDHIKPTDVVNVGMHRGDKDDMVEENVSIVEEVLRRDA